MNGEAMSAIKKMPSSSVLACFGRGHGHASQSVSQSPATMGRGFGSVRTVSYNVGFCTEHHEMVARRGINSIINGRRHGVGCRCRHGTGVVVVGRYGRDGSERCWKDTGTKALVTAEAGSCSR